MYVRSKTDYYHKMTKQKVLTECKQYQVIRSHKTEYTLRNDNNKISVYKKELFEIID